MGLTETERRRFDFECVFQRDWSRPLIGQTWKHTEGVDKDIRMLITNADADIWAYVVRDTVKDRALVHEVIWDFRGSRYANQLFKLKVLWVPPDFDADKESDRIIVGEELKARIVNDVLFNVVFGRLTAADVRFFLDATGLVGLNLAVLHTIATTGFHNYPDLSRRLGVSAGPLRERILSLVGCGLLWKLNRGSMYFVTLKGRVFLQLLRQLPQEPDRPILAPELRYILRLLDLQPSNWSNVDPSSAVEVFWTAQEAYRVLIQTTNSCVEQWGIDLDTRTFKIHKWESDPRYHVAR